MTGFVYIWRDRRDNRYYVGSHWGSVDDGYVCSSSWMNKAYANRPEDFKRRILEVVTTSRTDLLQAEQRWLSMIKPQERKIRYYNLCLSVKDLWHQHDDRREQVGSKLSESNRGRKHSEETKKKIAARKLGRKLTEEHKEKIRVNHKGTAGLTYSEESRKRISIAKRGKTYSPEARANMAASRVGKTRSEEAKLRMSQAMKLKWAERKSNVSNH